ncbi:MAG: hypothetical protein NVSMB48_10000 [Marmoricola sp.]|uniref:alpha/beta hydrolase n=1 Tax=Nocardioides sp. Root140 TaxID=1736460 RepID=UPI0006F51AC4|nr:alpha/beta hydrolase [Nocardioides sp. Root140]KQY49539.1 hypothetical protein ASD30_22545 [Nocardioides sp. Root140]
MPVVMRIHGSGRVLFDIDTYDASCRGLANKTRAIVVSTDYRRAPEATFPASRDDVLAAYRWVIDNAASFGGDPARVGTGGDSVGATAATCLQLAEAGEQLPAAQVCVYPLTTPEQYGESMEDAADGRPLNRAPVSWMAMHAFEGRPDAATDSRINLLGVDAARLAALPPTLVITDERDPLRSQGQERPPPSRSRCDHHGESLRRRHAQILRCRRRAAESRTGTTGGCSPSPQRSATGSSSFEPAQSIEKENRWRPSSTKVLTMCRSRRGEL